MGLSRRLFTKEFKLAAVRRLEQGVSIGEAARALEVNPNVLHRWRREFRTEPGNAFPGNGKRKPYLGKFISVASDWNPLKHYSNAFSGYNKPQIDLSDPWQFKNFL